MSELVLLPQHQAMLSASGICADVAAERGYQSITVKAELKRLGFSDQQQGVPTLLVPIHGVAGGVALFHHRPDQPRIDKKGKIVKYEFPSGSRMAIDVPPRILGKVRHPHVPLFITEGVKKADAAISIGLCCIALIGTWNWRGTNERGGKTALPDWEGIALKDADDAPRQVYIVYDSDVMLKLEVHQALVRLSAFLKQRGASVAYIYLPHGEDGSKVGLDDYLAAGHTKEELLSHASATLREIEDTEGVESGSDENESGSAAQKLIALASGVELFHTGSGSNFGRWIVSGHKEAGPIRSQAFRDWLGYEYYKENGKPAGSQALEDALRVLEGAARYDGEQHTLDVRCARDPENRSIWLDMADAKWRAINVRPGAWSLESGTPQPQFRRQVTQAPMPEPDASSGAADIELLRPFINVRSERDWMQLIAWLIAAWVPEIGHPVLVVHGEQGTAKSTLMRMLTLLVDPSSAPLRSEPRDIDAWVQAADHTWLLTLDNVSALPGWLSDAMCRAVTGEAFVKRKLYTDSEDVVMSFRRVVALTGIEVVAQRSDLLDRSILLGLEPIEQHQRRPESEVLAEFEAARPKIVGALLTILSGVLVELPQITSLPYLPRMADFARVGVAVERVLGWESGSFLKAYGDSLSAQNDEALSGLPIVEPLLATLDAAVGEWSGTAAELLQALTTRVSEAVAKRKEWPQAAKALSGQLRRIAPNLRAVGVNVVQTRTSKQRHIAITRQAAQSSVICVTSVTPRSDEGQINDANGCSDDAPEPIYDANESGSEDDFVLNEAWNDASDANDASLQALSCEWAEGGYEEEDDSYLEAIRR